MKSYKARGIVLGTLKYGEKGVIVHMLTDLYGRQSYMVQGVRPTARGSKMALLQPMFAVEFEGLVSSKMSMHRIKELSPALTLQSTPFDVRKSTMALFMAEVLYRLVRDVEPSSPLFDFVCRAVQSLDEATVGVANYHLKFLVELSRHMGFYPASDYREGDVLDMREGVFVGCAPLHGDVMSVENSRTLATLMTTDFEQLGTIPMNRHSRDSFLTAMLDYFAYHLDSVGGIRSVEILRTVFG